MHIENSRVKGTLIIRDIGGSRGGATSLNIVKSEEKEKKQLKIQNFYICLIIVFVYVKCRLRISLQFFQNYNECQSHFLSSTQKGHGGGGQIIV